MKGNYAKAKKPKQARIKKESPKGIQTLDWHVNQLKSRHIERGSARQKNLIP